MVVYKSFLIDHLFAFLRAFSPIFEQFHSKSLDRVTANPLPDLFLCQNQEEERKCISKTKSTDRHSKPELKRQIRKTKKRCALFCNKDIIPVEIYVDFFLKRRCPLSILNFFYSINGKSIIEKVV